MVEVLEKSDKVAKPPNEKKPPTATFDWSEDGVLKVSVSGGHDRIRRACGHDQVAEWVFGQVAALGSHGKRIDEAVTNSVLAFVDAMQPRDPAEALLLTQMAATHQAMMTLAQRLNRVDNIAQQDSAERALNKLARTYTTQMETLKRYRSKGQQVVRVERVTVQDGGQAIVGNVETEGRGRDET